MVGASLIPFQKILPFDTDLHQEFEITQKIIFNKNSSTITFCHQKLWRKIVGPQPEANK